MVFVAGLGVINVVYEMNKEAVGGVGKGVGWLRGEEVFSKALGKELDEEAEGKRD